MNKNLIRSRFGKHLNDYNENAKIQRKMAEKLISLCGRKKYDNILEIGCGTGLLTEFISKNIEFENYTAIDLVEDCEPFIKKIDERILFIAEDIESFESAPCNPSPCPLPQGARDKEAYDLIISNAALQWTKDFEAVVKKLKNMLAKNGELILSTFGTENFREIFYIIGTSLKYYSENELREMFPDFEIYPPEIHIMSFPSPKDVLKHLQLTGVNSVEDRAWTKKDLKSFENTYSSLCVKIPTLTYNPIYLKYPTVG